MFQLKPILLLLGILLYRGLLFPDLSYGLWSIAAIYVGTPVIAVILARYTNLWIGIAGVLVGEIVGVLTYGSSSGWENVTEDVVSQALFMQSAVIQTLLTVAMFRFGLGKARRRVTLDDRT